MSANGMRVCAPAQCNRLGRCASGLGGAVRQSFNRDARKDNRESVLALLKKEFEYTETPEQKKKLDGGKDEEEQ